MRICMLTSAALPPREGMGFYIWNLSMQLTERGHSVQIITRGRVHGFHREITANIPIWLVPFIPVYPLHVHLHSLFVDRLLRDLEQDLDLIHLHTPLVRYPRSNLPSLVTVHTPMKADSNSFTTNTPYAAIVKLQIPFSIRLEKEIFSNTLEITAVSNSVAQELTSYGINGSSVAVLGNGVDPGVFAFTDYPPGKRQPYILIVSRFPQIRFFIAGDGPYRGQIQREIKSTNMTKNVILLGHVNNRQQLAGLYQEAIIFVHPAHYEGLPTVLLEAMSCGRPVVATAVSGNLDVIEDGINGLLVPPHNPKQMANAIFHILDDPVLGKHLGIAARKTIKNRFSWQEISQNYLAIYERLV